MLDVSPITARLGELVKTGGSNQEVVALLAILNGVADFENKSREAASASSVKRYEFWKSFATAVVPLLTLMTLAVTIYFQWDQSRTTLKTNEDTQWRAVVDALTKPPGPTTDIVITTALLPFYDSTRYKSQAYEMTFLLAGRIASEAGFRSLFHGAFGNGSWENAADLERLGLALNTNYEDVNEVYQLLGGAERLQELSKAPRRQSVSNGSNIDQANHARNEILHAEHFLSEQVAQLLRQKRPAGSVYGDFSGFSFFETDLSLADFTGLDISNADFQRANLDNAHFTPAKFDGTTFNGTAWWRAQDISSPFLRYLLSAAPPNFENKDRTTLDATDVVILKSEYEAQVGRLCKKAKIDCKALVVPGSGTAGSASASSHS
jgi:uncharacterized protein YjbI with pentapeptide repeats